MDLARIAAGTGHRVKAPTQAELEDLLHRISTRLARYLEKEGVLEQDIENSYLNLDPLPANPLREVHGHSITYRIAVGPQQGRKVFTLQTVPPREDDERFRPVARMGGFSFGTSLYLTPAGQPSAVQIGNPADLSLHAGVATQAHQRSKLERICRYVARPAVSEKRLALTRDGRVRYALKTPYQDGTTHVIFEPLDIMYRMYGMPQAQGCAGAAIARLAALVPKPRVNLTRFHGVFAPNSHDRVTITPAKRGKGASKPSTTGPGERTPMEKHAAMTWARRLKRVFTKSRRFQATLTSPNANGVRGRSRSSPASKTRW